MRRFLVCVVFILSTVAMVEAGDVDYTFSGQLRFRPEMSNNYDFNNDTDDSKAFIGQRIRLNVKAKVGGDIEAFIQAQDSRVWGNTGNTSSGGETITVASTDVSTDPNHSHTATTTDSLDLFQAYLKVNNAFGAPLDIKIGRQTLVYGDQRLLGHLGWKDSARSFDAYKFILHIGESQADFFAAKLKESNNKPSSASEDDDLYGLYTTWKILDKTSLDVYYLRWQDDAAKDIGTYGFRFAAKGAGADFTIESVWQSGDWNKDTDIKQEANAFAAKAGYTFKNAWNTRIGLEYDHGSGDDGKDAKTHKTFVFPFHTNHGHYGYMDLFSWGNMQDIQVAIKTKPMNSNTVVKLAYHNLQLDKAQDTWLNVVGNKNLYGGNKGPSIEAGEEYDLTVVHPYNKNLKIVGGYSLFLPGDAGEERAKLATGTNNGSDTAHWGYTMFILNI